MNTVWKAIAWVFIVCGIASFLVGWIGIITDSKVFGIDATMYFYDAIATGIFGLFFLLYSVHSKNK